VISTQKKPGRKSAAGNKKKVLTRALAETFDEMI